MSPLGRQQQGLKMGRLNPACPIRPPRLLKRRTETAKPAKRKTKRRTIRKTIRKTKRRKKAFWAVSLNRRPLAITEKQLIADGGGTQRFLCVPHVFCGISSPRQAAAFDRRFQALFDPGRLRLG